MNACFERAHGSIEWWEWIPVKHGFAPSPDVVRRWSVKRVMQCLEVIRVYADIEALQAKEMERTSKPKRR